MAAAPERWQEPDAYERFIGRWSRKMAPEFVAWARIPPKARVMDVGCGTGALSKALLEGGARQVVGIDLSAAFVASAASTVNDERAAFLVGDASALDAPDADFDAVVSGLSLNFAPSPARALSEMARVTRPGGLVAVYVWDYAGKMEMLRRFWDVAVEVDPDGAGPLDEGVRFTICHPRPLARLFEEAGLSEVATAHVDLKMAFEGFDDYWMSFLGGAGPAPTYVASLGEPERAKLHAKLKERVVPDGDGRIALSARAWTARGLKP